MPSQHVLIRQTTTSVANFN